MKLSHIDEQGRAQMVDVTGKPETRRIAIATGCVQMRRETLELIRRQEIEDTNRKVGQKKQPAEFEAHCEYLSAWEEDKWTIAQANIELDEKGRIVPELANAHVAGKEIKLESAATGSPVPLHPGAVRYYKEKGLIK